MITKYEAPEDFKYFYRSGVSWNPYKGEGHKTKKLRTESEEETVRTWINY